MKRTPHLRPSRYPNRSWLHLALGPVLLAGFVSGTPWFSRPQPETENVAPGLKHLVFRKGSASVETRLRVLIETFEPPLEADALLARLEKAGLATSVYYRAGRYHLAVGDLATRAAAEEVLARLQSAGLGSELSVVEYGQDTTNPDGPWEIHVLEADPRRIRVEVAHAYDAAIGVETTSHLARRRGAIAAVNGGYFVREGMLRGDSQGILQIQGQLLSEPDRGRAAVGFYEDNGLTRAVFGRLSLTCHLSLPGGQQIPLHGINRYRGRRELVLYTPEFHRSTLTRPEGSEVIVAEGRVVEVRREAGSTEIPANGYVLSMGSGVSPRFLDSFSPGQSVAVEMRLASLLPDPNREWEKAHSILGGGPLLLRGGERIEEPHRESISRVFSLARHPRTAVGVRSDGTLLFVTVDGRQPAKSVGMSLAELTDVLVELGAVSAINLDGGDSTTAVVKGQVVNSPSGPMGERENANALLLFSRAGT